MKMKIKMKTKDKNKMMKKYRKKKMDILATTTAFTAKLNVSKITNATRIPSIAITQHLPQAAHSRFHSKHQFSYEQRQHTQQYSFTQGGIDHMLFFK